MTAPRSLDVNAVARALKPLVVKRAFVTEWSGGSASERPKPAREYAMTVVYSDIVRLIGSQTSWIWLAAMARAPVEVVTAWITHFARFAITLGTLGSRAITAS
jgi:hypothetical protein